MEETTARKPKRPWPPWARMLRSAGLALLASFVVLSLLVMFLENSMIYFPSRYPEGNWEAARHAPFPVEDVHFEASDGVKLHGWFVRGTDAGRTILFFHGNAGNLSDRYDWVISLAGLPADVFIIDYRGYGRSEGKPDEPGIYRDGEAAYLWLTETRGVPPDRLIVYGNSLGGAVACELASRRPCGGLILQSSFTSARAMAGVMMPILPLGWLVRTKFDNLGKVARIGAPKLIIHSRDDEMIPYWMGEKLHEAAALPKTFASFSGAGHNDLVWTHRDELIATIRDFLSLRKGE